MGEILGAAFGAWIIAAIISLALRKMLSLGYAASYAIGFIAAVPIGSYLYSLGNDHLRLGPLDMVPLYGVGAVIGFVLTMATRKVRQSRSTGQ